MAALGLQQLLSLPFEQQVPELLTKYDGGELAGMSCRVTFSGWKEHPPLVANDGRVHDEWSAYSSQDCLLTRRDYRSIDVEVDFTGGELVDDDQPSMFHGTEWGSVEKILCTSGGFIVGPGTHKVGKKPSPGVGVFRNWVMPSGGRSRLGTWIRGTLLGSAAPWC